MSAEKFERYATDALQKITEGNAEGARDMCFFAHQRLEGVGGREEDAQRLLRHANRALFLSRAPGMDDQEAAIHEEDAMVAIEEALQAMEGR